MSEAELLIPPAPPSKILVAVGVPGASTMSVSMKSTTKISAKTAVQFCVAEAAFRTSLDPLEIAVMSPEEALDGGRIPEHPDDLQLCLWVVSGDFLKANSARVWSWVKEHPALDVEMIVVSDDDNAASYEPLQPAQLYVIVPERAGLGVIRQMAGNAVASLQIRYDRLKTQSKLALAYQEMRRLTRVGQSLSTERDFGRLIELILGQARELVGADAGSIYVTERPKPGETPTHLRFKKSAMQVNSSEFLLPIDKNSIAGYVAFTGEPLLIDDVYALTGSEEYRFNFEYDKFNNYRSRSMMVIPMKNHRNEIIGVIQLINRKKNYQQKLSLDDMKGNGVFPFSQRNLELVTALAGQAAVAIQNNMLLTDINNLFEGFVTASVTAIEQRDPTTSGHSFRVADFTTGLARAVDRLSDGPFSAVTFSSEQMRELRYASLLHDFGKVGVKEKVLVKAKKLYEHEMDLIQWRFRYARKCMEKEALEKKLRFLKEQGHADYDGYERYMDTELAQSLLELDAFLQSIEESNEPAVVEAGNFEKLDAISMRRLRLDSGTEIPFLRENELVSLSVRRGNLDQQERLEIESHVTHTYKFLIQIPWTGDLRKIPDIARSHHEKLNGSGYPLGLRGPEISVQTRMMTISDIYDALTAPDRPYKKSLPAERALDILAHEARDHKIDETLLRIFIEAEIFKNPGDARS